MGRYVSIWFRHLHTDWFSIKSPYLRELPFVLRTPVHGRMVITSLNAKALAQGIFQGMVLADARAIVPNLEVQDDELELTNKLLTKLSEWCIRFSPIVSVDPPDGIIIDASGCSHLWGGDQGYLKTITEKLYAIGFTARASIADTAGLAWGLARYGQTLISPPGQIRESLFPLPTEALRLETETTDRLYKLGLRKISQFIQFPRTSLRRRFGDHILHQIDKAMGNEMELLVPVQQPEPYQERLPCMEPIVTASGIEYALNHLLEKLCLKLREDQKGVRAAVLKGYRVDGKVEEISIATNKATHHVTHLFKLFEIHIAHIEPALGIELFVLEATAVEDHLPQQEMMWGGAGGFEDTRLTELADNLTNKIGSNALQRYLPDEHYWPERSFRVSASLLEKLTTQWPQDKIRPTQILEKPELIEVTAPIPDYPPMLFRYKGKIHQIVKADGPERIEQEWWIQQGQHRDYYRVEDDQGKRYWLFRLGHYHDKSYKWFLHGFFA